MHNYRVCLLIFLILCVIVIAASRSAQPQKIQKEELRDYMHAKLDHTQHIIKGLALEDFDLIAKNAQELSLLSRGTNWNMMQTEEYLAQSAEFRRATDALRDAAKKRSIDGAALAYMETTLKCVSCHKYVRATRAAQPMPSAKSIEKSK